MHLKLIVSRIKGRLISGIIWLTTPAKSVPESLIHQSVLLAWTLLLVIPLALHDIIVIPPHISNRTGHIGMVLALIIIFITAFIFNKAGHYRIASTLTIVGAFSAPWSSMIMDPVILKGDIMPMNYVVIPVLLSSIFLPPVMTTIFAATQLTALAYVHSVIPVTVSVNWGSYFTFIIIASSISILASMIRQRDMKQIVYQRRLLIQSEAKLFEQSIHDHLTGLYNRRYLDETIEREISRAERSEHSVGFIMMDIDHFKQLNDKFGHAAGDIVLQEIGLLLKDKIRFADIVSRYGGEEFVVVMPEASLEITRHRAEELREVVKQLDFHYNNKNLGKVTISSGVAVFPDHGATGEEVLGSADTALFIAKRSGRDRVVVAS